MTFMTMAIYHQYQLVHELCYHETLYDPLQIWFAQIVLHISMLNYDMDHQMFKVTRVSSPRLK